MASLQSEPETLSGSGLGSLPACPWVQESRGLAGVAFGAAVGASYGVTVDTGAATSRGVFRRNRPLPSGAGVAPEQAVRARRTIRAASRVCLCTFLAVAPKDMP